MIDFGFDKIVNILTSQSETGFKDLVSKIKPAQRQELRPAPQGSRIRDASVEPMNNKKLEQEKEAMLRELRTVEYQIKHSKVQLRKAASPKRMNYSYENPQAQSKAVELLTRMNEKRRQHTYNQRKQSERMYTRVQDSLKKFKELTQMQQKQKQDRRLKIHERIIQRHSKLQMRHNYGKSVNNLIKQIQSYQLSASNIVPEFYPSEVSPALNNQRSEPSLKKYPKSPFLKRIQRQQEIKRKQQYLKSFEKKNIRERQQNYGRKIRKSANSHSVFVTD